MSRQDNTGHDHARRHFKYYQAAVKLCPDINDIARLKQTGFVELSHQGFLLVLRQILEVVLV